MRQLTYVVPNICHTEPKPVFNRSKTQNKTNNKTDISVAAKTFSSYVLLKFVDLSDHLRKYH